MVEPRPVEAWECEMCGMLFMDVEEAAECCINRYRRLNIEVVEPEAP